MALTRAEVLSKIFDDRVARATITGARTLANMSRAGRIVEVGKRNLDWAAEVVDAQAGIGLVTADTTNSGQADTQPAQLSLGTYRVFHRMELSRVDMREASQIAPGQLQNLFGESVDRAINRIARTVNSLIFNGVGNAATANVIGLGRVIDNTLPYAGINPANFPEWTAIVDDNDGTPRPFSREVMLQHDKEIMLRESMYDMVITHPTVGVNYALEFDKIAGTEGIIKTSEGSIPSVDLGLGGRSYNGYPLIEDRDCQADTIYMLNSQDVTLQCFTLDTALEGQEEPISQIVINRSYGMPIHIAELPSSNSTKVVFEVYVIPQLKVFNRKSVAAITNIGATPAPTPTP